MSKLPSFCARRSAPSSGLLACAAIIAALAGISAHASPLVEYGNIDGINRGTDACKPDDVLAALKASGFLLPPVDLNVRGIAARVPFRVEENREVGTHGFTRNGGKKFHAGTDVLGDEGETVVAVTSGKIISAAYHPALGNYAILRTDVVVPPALPCAVDFVYAHLQEVPATGDVAAGAKVGKIGRTGNLDSSIPTHLHIELWAGGYGRKSARVELTRDIMGLFGPF